MRTEVISESAVGIPSLEHFPREGEPAERTPLTTFPFVIGRNESADLQIDSARVSREHVVIIQDGNGYRVQDLDSTNGTFVNGQQITEAKLNDGDILVVANIEFTFFAGRPESPRDTATECMTLSPSEDDGGEDLAASIIHRVRRLQEMLTQCCIETRFQPIVGLDDGQVLGYEAFAEYDSDVPIRPKAARLLMATECRLTARIRQLGRKMAAEHAARLPDGLAVFLPLDASEIGTDWLIESLDKLQEILAPTRQLVIELPDSVVSDIPYSQQFRLRLQQLGLGIAYDGFAAGRVQLVEQTEVRPDFVKLARSLAPGIQRSPDRQRQVEALLAASREMGCEAIATGLQTEEEATIFRNMGCRFGQGDLFGRPRPIDAVRSAVGNDTHPNQNTLS